MKRASLPYVMLLSTGGCLWAGGDTAIVLDPKKQLFLDDYIIESATSVARVIHPARKYSGNPVLWDATVYGTVLHDEGRYRMWDQSSLGVHYAESQDGITWTKPLLDMVTVGGQKTNAVVLSPNKAKEGVVSREQFPYFAELFGVEKDPRDKDAARRYKMGFRSRADPAFDASWNVVKDWSEQSRYAKPSRQEAEILYAITDKKHGILSWIKQHW